MKHIKRTQKIIRSLIADDIRTNKNFRSLIPGILPMTSVVTYSLNSGKRLRPIIINAMIEGCGDRLLTEHSLQASRDFMLFIEYVHNASLIVDDLPCMDNDDERRGNPTVHIKYGEHMSQMVSYNLMITALKHFSDGFRAIQMSRMYTDRDCQWLYDNLNNEISENLGYQGICGGQLLDLLICKDADVRGKTPREQRDLIMKIIKLKTGCLFSLSFTLGWVARGGDVEAVVDIKEAGYLFGICYQIIDDLRDVDKDMEKNAGFNNICKYYTWNEIITLFMDTMAEFSRIMSEHQAWSPCLIELYTYMLNLFKKSATNLRRVRTLAEK